MREIALSVSLESRVASKQTRSLLAKKIRLFRKRRVRSAEYKKKLKQKLKKKTNRNKINSKVD